MLPTEGGVKLLDFGLAKLVDVNRSQAIDVAGILDLDKAASDDQQRVATQSVDLLAATMAGVATIGDKGSSSDAVRIDREAKAAVLSVSSQETPPARLRPAFPVPVPTADSGSGDSSRLRLDVHNRLAAAFGKEASDQAQIPEELWRADPLERTSTIKGTPLYMAPEVFFGDPASRQSDIYSLGAVLYELCFGKPPHYNTSLLELHRLVTSTDAPPLLSVVPSTDPRLAAVIDRCLSRDPAKRYGSADDLREALEQLLPSAQNQAIPEGNPYRGLLPFESQHRALFFGRQSEIGTLVDRLRTESFVVVAADSGVGKSSVCRAGVLPIIREGGIAQNTTYQIATMIPGRQPLRALCEAVATAIGREEQTLFAAIKTEPASFPRVLRGLLPVGMGLLIFVDQMEELVTIADPLEAKLVGEALGALAQKAGELRLLGTVRADFVSRVATVPGIGDEVNRGLYLLRPMGPDKLREAVVGPAQLKGVSFETDEMVDELVASTAESDAGLPLLQFALAELWDVRQGNRITAKALESIGGVMGALARHADHLIGSLPMERRPLARRLLMSLVTIEGTRARRSEEELTWNDPSAKSVLELLVRGRLLVARETPDGAAYEVAHEALLKGWGTLGRWLEENAERRAVKHRLEQATQEWTRLHKSREALWSPRQMAELPLLEPEDISPKEQAFIDASKAALQRIQLLKRAALLMVPVLMVAGYAGVQVAARRKLERQIGELQTQARQVLEQAVQLDHDTERLRSEAFAQFDGKHKDDGEKVWAQARLTAKKADQRYIKAAQILESALTLDVSRTDVREQFALALYQRAVNADRDRQREKRDELVERAEQLRLDVPLPALSEVPPGYVFVPKGRFLYGYGQDETLRKTFFGTAPLHQVQLDSYLISQFETTYGEWIEFLKAIPPAERKLHRPSVARGGTGGAVELKELPKGGWSLVMQPQSQAYSAKFDEPIVFPTRTIRKVQDWKKFPVAGISFEDALAYVKWLDTSGKMPGARLCTEQQWERAAKGADEREYPHGDELLPEDANSNETYRAEPRSWGPDEVGSHPTSNSPFNLSDMVGNHWELTVSSINPDEVLWRGGSYYFESLTSRSSNRNVVEPAFRSNDVSLRVCVPFPLRR